MTDRPDIATDAPRTGPRRGGGVAGKVGRLALAVYVGVIVGLLALPIALVVVASFQGGLEASFDEGWSLAAYEAIPLPYWASLWFTVKAALPSTAMALVVSVAAAWGLVRGGLRERRLVGTLILLPDAVPPVTLGIGLLALFIPVGLSNSLPGALVALTVLSLAMGLRFAEVLIEAIPEELEEAAVTMGANRLAAFLGVTLPLLAPGLAIAALFIFVHNLVTFELLLFVSGPGAMPISVLLFTDIVERGVLPQAIAMSALLVYVAIAFYTLIVMTVGMRHLTGVTLSRKG